MYSLLDSPGRPTLFLKLNPFLVGEAHETSNDTASRLGMTPEVVRKTISRMRGRCRQFVRAEIAATVTSAAEVDEEFRELLAALRG